MKRHCNIALATAMAFIAVATLNAQPMHNDTLRTVTWSFYTQGGLSGFHGMKGPGDQYTYDNTHLAPALDMGFFLYPRPWIRFGLGGNYSFLKTNDPVVRQVAEVIPNYLYVEDGGNSYLGDLSHESARIQNRNFTHIAGTDLTMGINFMEIWRERPAQWFNIWTTIGAGYMHGWNTHTQSTAWDHGFHAYDGMFSWNKSEVISPVGHNSFDAVYVPLGISAEFDIIPQLSLAAFGQYKFFPGNVQHTPTGIWTVGAGIRYNLVGRKQGFKNKRDRIRELESLLQAYERPVETAPVETAPVEAASEGLLEVDKPLSHYAVQIYAFRIFQHAPDDEIFFNDRPTIFRNGDLRRYVVFTGTLEEAKVKWRELRTRYHDAFIVYIEDDGTVVPYSAR